MGGGLPDIERFFNFITQRDKEREIENAFGKMEKVNEELKKNERFPRAITFAAGFYSFGIPPELMGTLECLRKMKGNNKKKLNSIYSYLHGDIKSALEYASKEWVEKAKEIKKIASDIKDLQDNQDNQKNIGTITEIIKGGDETKKKDLENTINEMAKRRHSLG